MTTNTEKIETLVKYLGLHYRDQYDGDLVERVKDAHDYVDKHSEEDAAQAWCDYEDLPMLVVHFLHHLGADNEAMNEALDTLELVLEKEGEECARERYEELLERERLTGCA